MNRYLLVSGICLLLAPAVCQIFFKNKQQNVVSTFEYAVAQIDEQKTQDILEDARMYNATLFEKGVINQENYWKELTFDAKQSGIMGSLYIPKIECKLPIRHGTEEAVLADSVGHVMESSLPIGGANTHSVLSGHRGLPGRELFTRLDELRENDLFYIRVGGEMLTYRVCKIQTVSPEDINVTAIRKGRDLVSLVTCTPYGLNTHRLVVTGERTLDYAEHETFSETGQISKWNLLPGIVVLCSVVGLLIRNRTKRKIGKEEKYAQHRNTIAKRKRRQTRLFKGRTHEKRRVSVGMRL